jgi:cell division protein FtsI (penicillin-binding protein 3)/stage V sporulation protein D (sporulation-specific penicillin-binding protein)
MTDVLTYSLNTGVVEVLRRLGGGDINSSGKQKLYDYFSRFKFGTASGVETPAEPAGQLNPPTSDDPNYANMTFGQGLTATMTQIVAGVAAIANGGTVYRPHLVDSIVGLDGQVIKETQPQVVAEQVISPQTAGQVRNMMETVVQSGGGTTSQAAGYRIGGKTGTAQIPNPNGGYYDDRDIGSFLGIGPLDNPRFVIVVRADEPQIGRFAGSAAAAPMFGEIMRWLLNYEGVRPSS